jgi:hypothetical protein
MCRPINIAGAIASVALLRRQLGVSETLGEVRGQLHFGPPKPTVSRRAVTMSAFSVEELAARKETDASGPSRF